MATACRSLAKLQSAAVDAVKTAIAALDKFCGRLIAGLQDLDFVLAELTPARNRRQIALASRRSCFLNTQGRDIRKTQATSRLIAGHGQVPVTADIGLAVACAADCCSSCLYFGTIGGGAGSLITRQ
jgi:hypothetical protein